MLEVIQVHFSDVDLLYTHANAAGTRWPGYLAIEDPGDEVGFREDSGRGLRGVQKKKCHIESEAGG